MIKSLVRLFAIIYHVIFMFWYYFPTKVVIYANFWLINKTGLPLIFKQEGTSSEAAGLSFFLSFFLVFLRSGFFIFFECARFGCRVLYYMMVNFKFSIQYNKYKFVLPLYGRRKVFNHFFKEFSAIFFSFDN